MALFSSLDGPLVHSRSYGFLLILPLYTHTIDLKSDTEIEGFPWPAWTRQIDRKTGRRLSLRLMPSLRRPRHADDGIRLLPVAGLPAAYRPRPARGYERRDVLFFFYRDQIEIEGDDRLATHALVPLWISRTQAIRKRSRSWMEFSRRTRRCSDFTRRCIGSTERMEDRVIFCGVCGRGAMARFARRGICPSTSDPNGAKQS
jgi:hypothetical protein